MSEAAAKNPNGAVTKEIIFEDSAIISHIYGENNSNLKEIENFFGVKIYSRGGKLSLQGGGQMLNTRPSSSPRYTTSF